MTTTDTRPSRAKQSGRHPLNIGHLVMGIAFVGIVVVWILIRADAVTGSDIRWLLPVPWVLAGVAGLLATTRRSSRDPQRWDDTDDTWSNQAYVEHQQRGWVGERPEPTPYDDLDEKLSRAEQAGVQTATVDPVDPADPADPAEPADPPDPVDPADPADPTDQKEHDR